MDGNIEGVYLFLSLQSLMFLLIFINKTILMVAQLSSLPSLYTSITYFKYVEFKYLLARIRWF